MSLSGSVLNFAETLHRSLKKLMRMISKISINFVYLLN